MLIRAIVISAYLGWIAYSAVHVLPSSYLRPLQRTFGLNVFAALVLAGFWFSFVLQHSSATLYLYIIFPVYFWHQAIERAGGSLGSSMTIPSKRKGKGSNKAFGTARGVAAIVVRGLLVVAALLSMVVRAVCNNLDLEIHRLNDRLDILTDLFGAPYSS